MVRILLNGCNGRMGQVVARLSKDNSQVAIAAGVDTMPGRFDSDFPVYKSLYEVKEEFDVIIDFSNIKGLTSLLGFGVEKKVPLVICTTGLSMEDKERIQEASSYVAILNSANMSLGANLLFSLVKEAVRVLEDSFDIEIIERHHNQKVDSPSGTALAIADAINSELEEKKEYVYGRNMGSGKRTPMEIGIHAVRGGSIVGDHSVIFAGAGEVIELNHSAISRDVFGVGALKAAKFLYNKAPGLYNMHNVVKQ